MMCFGKWYETSRRRVDGGYIAVFQHSEYKLERRTQSNDSTLCMECKLTTFNMECKQNAQVGNIFVC